MGVGYASDKFKRIATVKIFKEEKKEVMAMESITKRYT